MDDARFGSIETPHKPRINNINYFLSGQGVDCDPFLTDFVGKGSGDYYIIKII